MPIETTSAVERGVNPILTINELHSHDLPCPILDFRINACWSGILLVGGIHEFIHYRSRICGKVTMITELRIFHGAGFLNSSFRNRAGAGQCIVISHLHLLIENSKVDREQHVFRCFNGHPLLLHMITRANITTKTSLPVRHIPFKSRSRDHGGFFDRNNANMPPQFHIRECFFGFDFMSS